VRVIYNYGTRISVFAKMSQASRRRCPAAPETLVRPTGDSSCARRCGSADPLFMAGPDQPATGDQSVARGWSKRNGMVKSMRSPFKESGGGGNGSARFSVSSAAASRVADPDVLDNTAFEQPTLAIDGNEDPCYAMSRLATAASG
jgi:hypothetical protein